MATIIFLKKEDCYCDLTTFYVNVAKKLSANVTDDVIYDCRKVCVTKSVENLIWSYYEEQEKMDIYGIAALWLFGGPKTNLEEDSLNYRVSVENGFIISR